jgi:hypothetical protein
LSIGSTPQHLIAAFRKLNATAVHLDEVGAKNSNKTKYTIQDCPGGDVFCPLYLKALNHVVKVAILKQALAFIGRWRGVEDGFDAQ